MWQLTTTSRSINLKKEDEDDQPEGLETGGLEEVPDEEESEDEDFEENEK